MPYLLFWYILRDLLKVLVVSTLILVTVISFGAAIKPLSDGVLGPLGLMKYIALAIPPMLQFAVPFSAAFSATIVYHRMSSENEVAACAVSGVPYTQILIPAATLGVVLTIGLSLLANYVNPWFWERMERTAHLDAPEFFIRSVQQGIPVRADKTLIYAQRAKRLEAVDPEASAALWLEGLLMVKLDRGVPEVETTARQGLFHLYQKRDLTVISGVLQGGVLEDQIDAHARKRMTFRTERIDVPPFAIESGFRTKTKFMDLRNLQRIAAHPEEHWRVSRRVDELRKWLTGRLLYHEIDRQLRENGRIELIPESPGNSTSEEFDSGQRWVVYGRSVTSLQKGQWRLEPPTGESACRLVKYDRGRAETEFLSPDVFFRINIGEFREPRFNLNLADATQLALMDPDSVPVEQGEVLPTPMEFRQTLPNFQKPVGEELETRTMTELVKLVPQSDQPEATGYVKNIDTEIHRLRGVILCRLHERTALSLACLVMMLLGAVLAMAMHKALPLMVYLGSFVPAIAGILLIASGGDLLKNQEVADVWGMTVLWSGNFGMSVFILIVIHRITRN